MPVTARLSQLFYERLGEQIANELVDWFNNVDATYRSDLRELNELNFARFDAKLEQRIAELRFEIRGKLDTSVAERAFAQLEARIDKVAAELNVRIAEQGAALEKGFKEQARWTFLAWTTLLIPIIGLWMRR